MGPRIVRRFVNEKDRRDLLINQTNFPQIKISDELVKEVKNICRGVFSPLTGFLGQDDFTRVVEEMRLGDGQVWPLPIVLDVSEDEAEKISDGQKVLLKDSQGNLIAEMRVAEKFHYDKEKFCRGVFGTFDPTHPGVAMVNRMSPVLLGGELSLIDFSRDPFSKYNLDPIETRILFKAKGWRTVVGFQTRNVSHRAHEYLQRCALEMVDGLFINPVIGEKKGGDFQDQVILDAYQKLIDQFYPKNRVIMSILPLRMRYAGPREAVFHALVRKNFGCTHFVVGRDHAGVGDFYGPYDAQMIFDRLPGLGIQIMKFEHSFYCPKCGGMATMKTCPHNDHDRIKPSGTEIREKLIKGEDVSPEVMRPEICEVIKECDNPFFE